MTWRKAYDIRKAWQGILDRGIENVGYYKISEDDRNSFNAQDWDCFIDSPAEGSALFYYEWY